MLELVKGHHKRTGLAETVLVISISVCTNSTVSIEFYRDFKKFTRNFLLSVFVLSGLYCTCFSEIQCMHYEVN